MKLNLSSKIINKSKLNQKRSPKKRITILELMEQKMQPLILNTNENNTIDKENIIINKSGKKINISNSKSSQKSISKYEVMVSNLQNELIKIKNKYRLSILSANRDKENYLSILSQNTRNATTENSKKINFTKMKKNII